jgi:phosphohistidine swiveling domain-containing protein
MDVKPFLYPEDTPDVASMGGKACALARLGKNFPVPAWFVIPPHIQPERIRNDIGPALEKLGGNLYAIRSSAVDEDGAGHSFAGQFQTYLNVGAEDVLEKIEHVRSSGLSETVKAYRKQNGLGEAGFCPAVLVQRMVKADAAGVAFTADPVNHDRTTVTIIATAGLADRLVSGEINGDTYRVSRQRGVVSVQASGDRQILTDEQIENVSRLARKVEDHFGRPQDIEWAYEDGHLYLLQARPITTLQEPDDIIIWDNSNIVESYSGMTSPLTYSFARYVYGEVYKSFSLLMGVPRRKVAQNEAVFSHMLGHIQGHVYYNLLNWYRVLSFFPGFTLNKSFMENMMGVSESLPDHVADRIVGPPTTGGKKALAVLQTGVTLLCLIGNAFILPWRIREFHKYLDRALSGKGERLTDMSYGELADYYRTLEAKLLAQWHTPIINDFLCMIAFGASRKFLMAADPITGQQLHNDYMIGQGDIISAEPARRIREMAEIISAKEDIIESLINGDPHAVLQDQELNRKFNEYIKKFGDRCTQELKLESLTLHEDPTTLLQAIGYTARKSYKAEHESPADILKRAAACFEGHVIRRYIALGLLYWAKLRVRDRENLRFERTRVFGRVRRIFLEMGGHLAKEGYIAHPRDIFFLEIEEILGVIDGTVAASGLKGLVVLRQADKAFYESCPEPPSRFETSGIITVPVQARKDHELPVAGDGETRSGLGCCRGRIRATVRVIDDPRTQSLQAGEILVARYTDPGWIALFSNAAGIVVERGSLLSHSAIVAREMGIPAIVAVPDVMTWLVSGDVVEIDGASGQITRISHAIQ